MPKFFILVDSADAAKLKKEMRCVLPISVGHLYNTPEEVAAAITFINENFASCDTVIADTLQALTIESRENISHASAMAKARTAGETWRRNNEHLFQLFNVPSRIHHWDAFTQTDEYGQERHQIDTLFEKSEKYQKAVNATAGAFSGIIASEARRDLTRVFDADKTYRLNLEYIKQGCAVVRMFMKQYDVMPYPIKSSPAHLVIFEHLQLEEEREASHQMLLLDIKIKAMKEKQVKTSKPIVTSDLSSATSLGASSAAVSTPITHARDRVSPTISLDSSSDEEGTPREDLGSDSDARAVFMDAWLQQARHVRTETLQSFLRAFDFLTDIQKPRTHSAPASLSSSPPRTNDVVVKPHSALSLSMSS